MPAGFDPTDNVLYAFTPNDPYYATGTPLGFPGQWHLDVQTSGAAFDSNVVGAWNRDLTGQGVTIGIVDDGLQHAHPDLNPNYVAADSDDLQDGVGGDVDPSPFRPNTFGPLVFGDNHGTSVSGVAAARGGNMLGGTGAAPRANLAGLRIDFPTQTGFVDATLFHSSGANTNIKIKNHSYGVSIPYISNAAQAAALVTSHDAGTVHVFAAGNERSSHGSVIDGNNNGIFDFDVDPARDGDANKKHMQSLQETIDVAALASSGVFATYSNWGANVWVTAPSNSFRVGEFGITTTDRLGGANATGGYNYAAGAGDGDGFPDLDYTSTFGGTSSAAPLVSGIMALAKQAQPNLNTRMAKHLLAETSDIIDPFNALGSFNTWQINGAGYAFNQDYGFGLIDADELTSEARMFTGVTPLAIETIGPTAVGQVIPDSNLAGISRNFLLTGLSPLEEVEITLNVSHSWRGDLEAFLTSPMGTVSRLMFRNPNDSFNNITNWTFLSNEFWGEIPAGQWTLNVRDVFAIDVGTWNNYSVLAKMGSLIPVPEPATWLMLVFGFIGLSATRRR
jgi:subtilisin family serine protease